jgi:hypothetical protein
MRNSLLALLLAAAPLDAQAKPQPDPLLGSFVSEAGSITVAKEGANYTGTIRAGAGSYRYTARKIGRALIGSFEADGSSYLFQASVEGDQMTFVANGETTLLRRGAAPSTTTPRAAPQTAQRPQGSGEDAQLQRLLVSSPWCYLRYSQTLGSTSTERAQFFPDGRLAVQSNYEMVSSGQNGTAYGSNSGATIYRWRVSNGDLHLAEGGGAFQPAGLRVTRNSNGYPILNVGGKEYSQCN